MRLAAIALAVLTFVPGSAHAAGPEHRGSCALRTVAPEVVAAGDHIGDRTRFTGLFDAEIAVYDPAAPATLVGVTVRCVLKVDTATVVTTAPAHGTTLVVTAEQVTFTAAPTDVVSPCTELTFDAGGTQTYCADATAQQIVPQPVFDAVTEVDRDVTPVVAGAACPITGESAATRELAGAWAGVYGYTYGYGC
jgi:hypothetical protein